MRHRIKQRGLAHLVLERGHRIAERWRSERWDGLRFQFPNWSVRLPDFAFPHDDPDGFAASRDILDFITAYAAFVAPPIRCGVAVTALRRGDNCFVAETSDGAIAADNVVVATGPYQRAVIPAAELSADIERVSASTPAATANPDQPALTALVLVVGAGGASGAQIADELLRAGRRVYLSVSRHTRLPRRLPRPRPDLVAARMRAAIDQAHAGGTRKAHVAGPTAGDLRRPWRRDHRLSAASPPTGIDLARADQRRRADQARRLAVAPGSRGKPRQRRCDLCRLCPRPRRRPCTMRHARPRNTADAGRPRRAARLPPDPAMRNRAAAPARSSAPPASRRGDLGHRLWRGFRLDRSARAELATGRGRFTGRGTCSDVPEACISLAWPKWLSKMNSSFLSRGSATTLPVLRRITSPPAGAAKGRWPRNTSTLIPRRWPRRWKRLKALRPR